jgi:anti-anti-sigma factor
MANYELESARGNCRVRLHRSLTAVLVPELQEALKAELGNGTREFTFDFSQTEMIDSTGIGLLIAASNSLAQSSGHLAVINASPQIFRLLRNMRLISRLNVSPAAAGASV